MKILLFLSAIFIGFFAYSQLEVFYSNDLSNNLDGDTLFVQGLSSESDIHRELYVVNAGAVSLDLRCRTREISVQDSTKSTTCWDICPAADWAGDDPDRMSPGFITVASGDTVFTFSFHHRPENVAGVSIYQFDWVEDGAQGVSLATTAMVYDVSDATGITDNTIQLSIELFPNPSDEKVSIDFSSSKRIRPVIEVYDILGKKVYTNTMGDARANVLVLNTEGFRNGVYFVSIASNGSILKTEKLIVKH